MPSRVKRLILAVASALCMAASLLPMQAHAINVMDLRAEQLMAATNEAKAALGLTPNQQTLWQQLLSKARAVLHTRQLRREKLQADLKTRLGERQIELRELAATVDEEAVTSALEDKQLRDLMLSFDDALDDNQRAIVRQFLIDQLDRADLSERRPGAERGEGSSGRRGGGRREGVGGIGGVRF